MASDLQAPDVTLPRVSVVVPTHNRVALLPALLAALDAQDYASEYEVILVDDASTDATTQALAEWAGEQRRVLRLGRPSGSYAARNAGWRSSSGEIVAFTDDDCVPEPGWLSALVGTLTPEMVGIQGRTLAEPGEITPFTHQIDQRQPGPPYRTCNVAYRRTVLEQLGGFDDSFRWYADNILGLRARELGPIGFAAGAVVRHPPRARQYRDVADWLARFDADARHRQALHDLGAEPVSPPQRLLPIMLWILRPLVKQSVFHLRYLFANPGAYVRGILPMLREKWALLVAMQQYYRSAHPIAEPLMPLPDRPVASVVVVTRDRPALLEGALAALRNQTWQRREIVVVDHGETLEIPDEDVYVVHAPGTTLGGARQRGVNATGGHVVAFTDDDCLPQPDWLEKLVEALQRNRTWWGVQGRTVAEQGPPGSHAVRVSRPNTLYQTSNVAYRRDALRDVGGFDTAFTGWFEDTALAARVLQRGAMGFAPNAIVVHRAVPRRRLDRTAWRALIRDERTLAERYPGFYRRTRGPNPDVALIARWLIGSPLKTLLRALPAAIDDPERYRALALSLLEERRDLVRALLDERRDRVRAI